MPRCKDCTHYWSKSFPEMPWNYECKFGHSTPDYGDTESCSDFEEQYTIGLARGWSYREEKQREGKEEEEYEHDETENVLEKKEGEINCSDSSGTYYSGSYSSNSDSEKICGFILSISIISFFIFIIFNINSCQKKAEEENRLRALEQNRINSLVEKSKIPTEQTDIFFTSSYDGHRVKILIDDVSITIVDIDHGKENSKKIYFFEGIALSYVEYNKKRKYYSLVIGICLPAVILHDGVGYSRNREQLDMINKKIYLARKNWKEKYEEILRRKCFTWD